MNFKIETLHTPPAPDDLNPLLRAYYTGIIRDIQSLGIPFDMNPETAIRDFWEHLEGYMPPNGVICIARDPNGKAVGCGMLGKVGAQTAELKRLFVDPSMRGTGLGRALVTRRIDIAKDMGVTRLVVDTVTSTKAMQALYASLDFQPIPPYPESATVKFAPQILPVMLFFEKHLTSE